MPGRCEAIAEGFKGRKDEVETIIAKAKGMGLRKWGDQNCYKKFLKAGNPVDQGAVLDEGVEDGTNGEIGASDQNGNEWSGAEDLALLNALKAFPKDVAMRWEKIAASVPGKTKASAQLKKGYRSSKASPGGQAS